MLGNFNGEDLMKTSLNIILLLALNFKINIAFAIGVTPPDPTFFVKVNPAGTYLTTSPNDVTWVPSGHYVHPAVATELDLIKLYNDPAIMLKPGDSLSFELVGDFVWSDETGDLDIQKTLGAVFKGQNGLLYPGARTTAPIFQTMISDIPNDFGIPANHIVLAQIPQGATKVLFSVNDEFFSDNFDPNNNFGVTIKIKIQRALKFKSTLGESIRIEPSIFEDVQCRNNNVLKKKKFLLSCEDENGISSAGCSVSFRLSLIENGGHAHQLGNRPMGELYDKFGIKFSQKDDMAYDIPKEGLEVSYLAPDISGKYLLEFGVWDDTIEDMIVSSSTKIVVRSEVEYVNLPDLNFVINSHPGDGSFGVPLLAKKITELNLLYKTYARDSSIPEGSIVALKSEAASLFWGGLFDIDQDWDEPHCGHRDGKTLDLSLSVFYKNFYSKELKTALSRAVTDSGFVFYGDESPANPEINHWHISF